MVTYFVEGIYRFACNNCDKWFSINEFNGKYIVCPHCGYKELELKAGEKRLGTND